MRLSELQGRRVGILGFGQEGQAALDLINRLYPATEVTVFNESTLDDRPGDAHWVIGTLDADRLTECEILIKSPGISLYRSALESARAAGVQLTSGTALWFAEPRTVPVIAVTGSKGKSTTAALIDFLLQQAGLRCPLAGNIGVPLLSLWGRQDVDAYVVELSSYQTADFNGRPDVAVLTNLFPEHLNWHGTEQRYYRDKLRIFEHRPASCLVNGGDPVSVDHTRSLSPSLFNHCSGWMVDHDEVSFAGERVAGPPAWRISGAHNRVNLSAALAVLDALGVDVWPGLTRLEAFKGLPHRMQVVGDAGGVMLVDDSISTAPQATVVALETFAGERLSLIVGGQDRGLDWHVLADRLASQPVQCVITMGECGPRIADLLVSRAPGLSVVRATDLAQAVARGLDALAGSGILLLSPGAPSYDQFQDYRQRGEVFLEAALGER